MCLDNKCNGMQNLHFFVHKLPTFPHGNISKNNLALTWGIVPSPFFSDPKEEIGVDFSEIEVVPLVWVYVKIVLSNF